MMWEGCGLAGGDLDLALAAARRGEEPGFAELWHALQPAILRYLRAVVGDAAEDVASETWLQAAKDVRSYRGDAAGFRVWLFRVARHRALDELRRTSRRKEENGDVESYVAEWAAPEDTEGRAEERENTERALRLIARLPKDQAEAVLLRVVAGLDVAQTAKVLGKRDGAVRIAAMRGLKRLAAILAEEGIGDMGSSGSTGSTGSTGGAGGADGFGAADGVADPGGGRDAALEAWEQRKSGRGTRQVPGGRGGPGGLGARGTADDRGAGRAADGRGVSGAGVTGLGGVGDGFPRTAKGADS
jgi:RNA polymerase sigma-70 factor (ECF subfamily)